MMNLNHENKTNYWITAKYFVIIFTILLIIAFNVLFYLEEKLTNTKRDELQNQENKIVGIESNLIGKEISGIISDLNFLHHSYETKISSRADTALIAEEWKTFSNYQKIYDQIRFIDKNGDEKIRINYSNEGATIVDKSKLQNKKDRYYFYETVKLEKGQIYISKLDLNIENGVVEIPYKPMMRFSSPVYDKDGQFIGIIVLNYIAKNLIEEFRKIGEYNEGKMYLLNSNGYWISSYNSEDEWGFMFEEKENVRFNLRFPDEWERIIKNESSIITENGLFTSSDVVLKAKCSSDNDVVLGEGDWKIVSYLSSKEPGGYVISINTFDKAKRVLSQNLIYFGLIFIISLLLSLIISMLKQTYIKTKFFSEYDAMTGVLNRRTGMAILEDALSQNNRRKTRFCLCMVDINDLKKVNDTIGHEAGDELILTVTQVIKKMIRDTDNIFRFGGDEFIILFNNSDYENAEGIWSRVVERFEQINREENRSYLVSVSHGIVDIAALKDKTSDEIIKMADMKMYQEKKEIKQDIENHS